MKSQLAIIVCVVLSCCTSAEKKASEQAITDYLVKQNLQLEKKLNLVVVPTNGCHSCISKMIDFALHTGPEGSLFIISGRSGKSVRLILPDSVNIPSHLMLDTAGYFTNRNLVSEFPVLFTMEDSGLRNKVTVDARNIDSVTSILNVIPE